MNTDSRFFNFWARSSVARTLLLFGFFISTMALLPVAQAVPPVTNITSSGLNTTVTPNGNESTITGGTRSGSNLFHSFGNFSVGSGDIANFFNDSGLATTNILSRVTGGNVSNIFGTIRTTDFGSANLFLLNPAGVIFGPNASLDIGGSFHVSTADYIKHADGSLFRVAATPAQDALLTGADPVAFGFLGSNPGSITVQGATLTVTPGQTLSLVGGDVTITGATLTAPSGSVQIASVASPGELSLAGLQLAPNINGDSFSTLANINITDASTINVSGDPGGTVVIRGGRLTLDNGSIIQADSYDSPGATVAIDVTANEMIMSGASSLLVSTEGAADSGSITLNVGTLSLTGDGTKIQAFNDFVDGRTAPITIQGVGGAGTKADTVTLSSGAQIVTDSELSTLGNGSPITINARTLTMSDGALIQSITDDLFFAGVVGADIIVTSENLTITSGAFVQSLNKGPGTGGTLNITADNSFILAGAKGQQRSALRSESIADGPQGEIIIQAGSMEITGGAQVRSTSVSAPQGANVTVTVDNGLNISGEGAGGRSGILIFSAANGGGVPGDITIHTGGLSVSENGLIQSGSISDTGQGGNVTVTAGNAISVSSGGEISSLAINQDVGQLQLTTGSLSMNGGTIKTSTDPTSDKKGGDINISAGSVQLNNNALITAESQGTGNAGNITIDAGSSFVANNSTVTTAALQTAGGSGGNITIQARDLIHLTNSTISSSVGNENDIFTTGGNIIIDPTFIILNSSQILAQAFAGTGGNITITAGSLFVDPASVISASSQLGVSGTVNIQAPINNLSEAVSPLSSTFQQTAALLQARCAAQMGGRLSTFVLAGRDGIPAEPGGLLPSPLLTASLPTAPTAAYTGADVDRVSIGLARLGISKDGLQLSGGWHLSSTAQEALTMGCTG